MTALRAFIRWFLLGAGMTISALAVFHSIHLFNTMNIWWWEHLDTMATILIVGSGTLIGLVAVSLNFAMTAGQIAPEPLELHTFISRSLEQALSGIREANNAETGGAPIDQAPKPFLLKHGIDRTQGEGIEFDIAVTTKSATQGKGSVSAAIYVVNGQLGKQSTLAHEQVSRMKFTVFVNQWRG